MNTTQITVGQSIHSSAELPLLPTGTILVDTTTGQSVRIGYEIGVGKTAVAQSNHGKVTDTYALQDGRYNSYTVLPGDIEYDDDNLTVIYVGREA